jgi:ribosomal protein S18 acetylase RimI-like enzyme
MPNGLKLFIHNGGEFHLKTGYVCTFAKPSDIEDWMRLVDIIKDDFPGLVMEDYLQTLIKNINRQSAICVKHKETIVGILIYSLKKKTLSCMAVHPEHRQIGIATAMIEKMITMFPENSEIWVTTFREDDPKGDAPRALYKKMGFVEDELVMEFGYPNQKLLLLRH